MLQKDKTMLQKDSVMLWKDKDRLQKDKDVLQKDKDMLQKDQAKTAASTEYLCILKVSDFKDQIRQRGTCWLLESNLNL